MKPNEVGPDFDPAEALAEGAAQEEAWRLAADAPDVWTRTAVDDADLDEAIAASPVPIDREGARELFEPLASGPREVVLDRVLMGFVEDRTAAGDAAVEGVSREVVLDRGVMRVAGDSPARAMSRKYRWKNDASGLERPRRSAPTLRRAAMKAVCSLPRAPVFLGSPEIIRPSPASPREREERSLTLERLHQDLPPPISKYHRPVAQS